MDYDGDYERLKKSLDSDGLIEFRKGDDILVMKSSQINFVCVDSAELQEKRKTANSRQS